jgi:nicotinamide-nucleotide amidase
VRAEIVAVGSELLLGEAVDTNSAWIAARLAEVGVDVYRHVTVGDNPDRLVAVLAESAGRADAVIVTGGLGPTQDDLTREAVARLAGVGLRRDPGLEEYVRGYFTRLGRRMPARNLVQADLPEGARVLEAVGTAAGFALDVDVDGRSVTLYCLPGVPREMEIMFARSVAGDLVARAGLAVTVSRLVRTSGMSESAVAEAAADLVGRLDRLVPVEGRSGPTIAFLATKGETRVRVTAKATSRDEALALVGPVVEELRGLLGTAVSGIDDEGAEHAIARLLVRHCWTLAVAESVSGGHLASRLVRVPGASSWFSGGLVTYTAEAKTGLAGVAPETIERHSPVSEEVAAALASGARERLGADVGVGVVGVAGPASQGGRPVGTLCIAVALPGEAPSARTLTLPGRGREELQEWAATVALDQLRRRLAESR